MDDPSHHEPGTRSSKIARRIKDRVICHGFPVKQVSPSNGRNKLSFEVGTGRERISPAVPMEVCMEKPSRDSTGTTEEQAVECHSLKRILFSREGVAKSISKIRTDDRYRSLDPELLLNPLVVRLPISPKTRNAGGVGGAVCYTRCRP